MSHDCNAPAGAPGWSRNVNDARPPNVPPASRPWYAALTRWLALAALAGSLTGCGLGLVYPRLDSVVGFYIEGLVTLDKAQSAELKQILVGNLEWHRRSELDKYSAFLRELAVAVERSAGREAWLAASGRTEDYWRRVFEQAAPGYARLAASFTDEQVAELLANLERKDEKDRREFDSRTLGQRAERREKSIRRALERFTGPLTPSQRELVRVHVASSPSFMPEWLENRRVWRAALADALAGRGDVAGFEARMQVLVARPDELWTPQYRAAVEQRRESLVDFVAALDATLTTPQRASARRQLLALADEVQRLGGRRG